MKKRTLIDNLLAFILLFFTLSSCSKPKQEQSEKIRCEQSIKQLEVKVYDLNNLMEYDSSLLLIHQMQECKKLTPEEYFKTEIIKSLTYKRLFDYTKVFQCLNKAQAFANKTTNKNYYLNQVKCEQAYAYFDITRYEIAESLMRELEKDDFFGINAENQAKIIMQIGYLHFKDKNYFAANKILDSALLLLEKSCPRDLPMIYGKKIELYGETKELEKMHQSFEKGIQYADSFKIEKYRIYLFDLLWKSHAKNKNYKEAFATIKSYDSLNTIYDKQMHLDHLYSLERKFNLNKKENALMHAQHTISKQKSYVTILVLCFILFIVLLISIFLFNTRQKIIKERKMQK